MNGHTAFYRPSTPLNSLVDYISNNISTPRNICMEDLERWKSDSFTVFQRIVKDGSALERAISQLWILSSEKSPQNTWFGEVLFCDQQVPQVKIYESSVTTRLPKPFFELAAQSGVDHVIGHLYAFYEQKGKYDEEVACRYQFLAAKAREGILWQSAALTIPLIHLFHKEIPLRNYK